MTTQSVTIMSDTIVKLPVTNMTLPVKGQPWYLGCDAVGRVWEFVPAAPMPRSAKMARTVEIDVIAVR